ncbi:gamma-secretase subunit APH-1A isoform X4 [Symphalangus syndactylus]|uniref:gamma-secretase subunit APH-1A isoform X4 n=1 Tax=Symphalangus syndactylus TaxID=9590 RepID=UPI003004DEE0
MIATTFPHKVTKGNSDGGATEPRNRCLDWSIPGPPPLTGSSHSQDEVKASEGDYNSQQEVFRFAYYKLLKKADEGLASLSEDGRSPISIRQMAYVSGLSFGIISGVFSVINILADALGPGVVGIHGDSPYYFLTSAFLTAAIILLHTFWGVVFFDACERRRYWALGLVVGSHLLTSGLTFLNPWYEASLLPIYAVTVSMGLWAFITAGGSLRSIQRSLLCKD